jgi:hypothetical protein
LNRLTIIAITRFHKRKRALIEKIAVLSGSPAGGRSLQIQQLTDVSGTECRKKTTTLIFISAQTVF